MTSRGILHLAPYLQGGAGRAIVDLACAQRRLGRAVTVVASETGHEAYGNYTEYLEQLRRADVALHLCDSLFKRDLLLNLRVLEMLRDRVDVDMVDMIHAHAAIPALIGRLFASHAPQHIPVVQTQHGWGTSKTAAQAATDLAILRDVDRVITTSAATRAVLASYGVPAHTIAVIPCGLAPDSPGPPSAEARRTLQPIRDRGARVIGCIGSVTPNKNQQLLVEALSGLADLDVVAVFLGEGGDALLPFAMKGTIKGAKKASVAERVIACGYRARAARWLPLMDLLVLPSHTEGQGLVVLEAFRAGVPVVVSDIPALAELVDDKRNGFLFEANNASALAGAVRAALELPARKRDAVIRSARARFLEDFTCDRMVARHEALYTRLASDVRQVADKASGLPAVQF